MRQFIAAAFLATTAVASPAFAQDAEPGEEFNGFYIGGSVGATLASNDDDEVILFDRDLNGSFGDTVTTSAGANAFSTGFCSGSVGNSPTRPGLGCRNSDVELEFSGRIGFDYQMGGLVFGAVAEVTRTEYSTSVTAFSTTPASYTFTRELDLIADLRARLGFTVTPTTLIYATAGGAYGKLETRFTTTNTVNSVNRDNLDDESLGFVVGGGVEQKIGRDLSVGIEYLYRQFEDESSVRLGSQAGTPATNPFILGNANGTDFIRSTDSFDVQSVRAVLNFRF